MLFALAVVVILGVAGLAVDYSRLESTKSKLQLSLDAAVLAGAIADPADAIATAKRHFANEAPQSQASFSLAGNGELVGTVDGHVRTGLMHLLGVRKLHLTVTSSATRSQNGRVCALVLDATAPQALLINNGARVSADCEFHVRSTGNPAAVFNAGTQIDTTRLCLAGTNIIDNGGNHANLELGCTPAGDPYAGQIPAPAAAACDFNGINVNGGSVALTPGVYCGGINFNAAPDVTFAPGLYVIRNGNWNVNGGSWSGNGVTFFFADSSIIQFNSAVSASLTPPSIGTYAGIAMFEADGLARSPFVLDDSKKFDLSGLIYLPSRDTIFNGASSLTNKAFTLVVNTLILNQTVWDLTPGEESFSSSGSHASVRLTR